MRMSHIPSVGRIVLIKGRKLRKATGGFKVICTELRSCKAVLIEVIKYKHTQVWEHHCSAGWKAEKTAQLVVVPRQRTQKEAKQHF